MKKFNKNYLIWITAFAIYALFIFVFSYLYPYGTDEYIYAADSQTLSSALNSFIHSYNLNNPRIGLLINNLILWQGKWLFLILNPILQVTLIISIFGLIYTRLPKLNDLKDMPVFILIAVMSVFFITKPDNTLFWLGGACNYSWSMLPFIWLLTLLKYTYENKAAPKLSAPWIIIIFILAIILGMTNENNAPAAMLALIGAGIVYRHLKIKFTPPIIAAFLGLLLGITLLFAAPGSYKRLNIPLIQFFAQAPMMTKIFWHIPKLNDLIVTLFFLPVILPLFIALEAWHHKRTLAKRRDLVYAALSYIMAFILAAVLALAPIFTTTRPFYSASVMLAISLIFTLKYFDETYRTKLIRYFAMLALIISIFTLPFFTLPYISLYKQDKARMSAIASAKAQGKDSVYVDYFFQPDAPTNNFMLLYYDVAIHNKASSFLGIEIKTPPKKDNSLAIL